MKARNSSAWTALAVMRHGTWDVRICQPNLVDHFVAIAGNRGLMLDSWEMYSKFPSEEGLRFPGGGDADNLHGEEDRKIVCMKNQ